MTENFATVEGQRLTALTLVVGNVGPWYADCDFEVDPAVSGRVTIAVGPLELSGTVQPQSDGTYGLQRKCRIVAGAGGWPSQLKAKAYHNDAGVKARAVAEDAAREAGESLGTFVPRAERIGNDFARQVGPASRTLEQVLGGAPWWVDYAGVTNVGPRAATPAAATAYEVLAYDPRSRVVELAVDDPGAVRIGSVLSERLDAPQTVRELELRVTAESVRLKAWCGGTPAASSALAATLRAISGRSTDGYLWGKYRYRVVRMAGDRVELQAVRSRPGLPDLLPLSVWPGIAGAHADLAPSAEVLVEFIEGDAAQPIVTAFAGKDGIGFVPTKLTLGGEAGAPSARSGDSVEVLLPPAVFSGTIGAVPASGVLTFPMNKTLGTITGGSSKVAVAD